MSERRGLFGLSFETIGSISAIVVGIAALIVSVVETNNARQLRYASALPIVEAGMSVSGDDEDVVFRITLNNAGVGPALVGNVEVLVDGEPLTGPLDFQTRLLGADMPIREAGVSIDIVERRPLPAGAGREALILRWDRGDTVIRGQQDLLRRLLEEQAVVQVCYCDIYERCWLNSGISGRTEDVDACPAPSGFPTYLLRRFDEAPQ